MGQLDCQLAATPKLAPVWNYWVMSWWPAFSRLTPAGSDMYSALCFQLGTTWPPIGAVLLRVSAQFIGNCLVLSPSATSILLLLLFMSISTAFCCCFSHQILIPSSIPDFTDGKSCGAYSGQK
jgi:acyl-CoA synthetase (AMP-forming)/AMP-acid ligase II